MSNITEENLIWAALDAPKLVPADWDIFWKKWKEHAGPSYLVKSDPAGNALSETSKDKEFFIGLNIYAKDKEILENGHWKLPYLDYTEIFPNVLDDIHAACPWIEDIVACRLWNSSINIPFHRDYGPTDVAIRSIIYDENPKCTFKVFKRKAGVNYVKLPDDTNWFVYNNATCLHGSDKNDGLNKVILLIVHTLKDKSMMEDHLKSSASKYPLNHCYL
jgi:hypothetical protein